MRGVKDHHHPAPAATASMPATMPAGAGGNGELAAALREAAAELRAVRETLARRN
jgi:hypothetical protein